MPTLDRLLKRTDPDDAELAERLPLGYKDPKSPAFIPDEPGLRQAIADYDRRETDQIRKELLRRGSGDVSRRVGRQHWVIDPADSDAELDLAVLWVQIERIGMRRRDTDRSAVYAAAIRRQSGCPCCGNLGARRRPLPDGTTVNLCPACHAAAEAQVLDRLGNETLADGRTRAAAVAQLLDQARR